VMILTHLILLKLLKGAIAKKGKKPPPKK